MSKSLSPSICFVLPYWVTTGIGGAELQCYLLSQELVADGWQVEVLSMAKPIKFENYTNDKIRYRVFHRSSSKVLTFLRCLLMLFKTKADVIYTRTDARILRGACAWYCRLKGKKLIYAMAHDVEVKPRYYRSEVNKPRWRFKNLLKNGDNYWVDRLVHKAAQQANLILAQTYFQKRELLRYQNLLSVVLRNSFDIASTPVFEKEDIVLWVGNFRSVKRPELFMQLADDLIDTKYRFVMIGMFFNREEETRRVKNPRFEALGGLSMEETLKWFEKAKVLVVTSEGEGFSNVFIQAWAYRVQILSLSVDPDDLLRDKGMGCLFNGDYEMLKGQLRHVIDQGTDSVMLEHAFSIANDEFDLKSNVQRFKHLVAELDKEI